MFLDTVADVRQGGIALPAGRTPGFAPVGPRRAVWKRCRDELSCAESRRRLAGAVQTERVHFDTSQTLISRAAKNPSIPPRSAPQAGMRAQEPLRGRPPEWRTIRPAETDHAAVRTAPRHATRGAPPPAAASRPHRSAGRRAAACAAAASSSLSCACVTVCTSRGRLIRATSGWRRIVPVALHGASSSTASNRSGGLQRRRVGVDHVRVQLPARQVCASAARSARRRAPPPSPPRPRRQVAPVLPPGAAHRSATRSPGCGRQQPRRQRRGGVLHPKLARLEARNVGHRRAGRKAHRSGRQQDAALRRRRRPASA